MTNRTKTQAKDELIQALMMNKDVSELAWLYNITRLELIKRLECRFYIYTIGGEAYSKIDFTDKDSGVKIKESI